MACYSCRVFEHGGRSPVGGGIENQITLLEYLRSLPRTNETIINVHDVRPIVWSPVKNAFHGLGFRRPAVLYVRDKVPGHVTRRKVVGIANGEASDAGARQTVADVRS
jgi:hypothetical protein